MSKQVTEKEIESGRISLPARVRDDLFPHVSQNSKTAATMVDENGDSHDVVLKVRHNRTKPEIMAKGGKKFSQKRKLKPGDVLVFSRGQSGDHFKVTVKRGPRVAGFSARSQPPATATKEPVFGQCLIGSDIAPRTDTELRLGGFSARGPQPLASTVPAYDHASSMETLVLGLGGPLAGSQTSAPAFSQSLIGSDDHATVALGLGSLSAKAQPTVALRLSLSIGSEDMPVVQPAPRTDTELRLGGFTAPSKPLASTGSDDHASSVIGSPSMETLVLGLGGPLVGSQTSAPAFSQSLIGSDDHATLPLGLGSLSAKAQPTVALRLSLSIGSDDMPVELSLSNGSNHAPPIKPILAPPAPAMVLMSSSVGRIKAEVQEVGVGVGPTLELTLGLGPPPAVFSAKAGTVKFVEAAEANIQTARRCLGGGARAAGT